MTQEQSGEAADGEDTFEMEEPTPRVSSDGSILTEDGARELAKFVSQKEHKRAFEAGVELFGRCTCPCICLMSFYHRGKCLLTLACSISLHGRQCFKLDNRRECAEGLAYMRNPRSHL